MAKEPTASKSSVRSVNARWRTLAGVCELNTSEEVFPSKYVPIEGEKAHRCYGAESQSSEESWTSGIFDETNKKNYKKKIEG